MIITAGKLNKSIYFYIVGDASHASPGDPITGLLFSDIETGGSASYARQGAARVDLTLITLASASATHADGGFIEVDATNMPGVYRCDYPDAAWVSGVDQVFCQLVAASANNAAIAPVMVDITNVDLRDAVRAGLTSLPNAAADAAGGLAISDAGGLDLDAKLGFLTGDAYVRLATYRLGELMSAALASQPFSASLLGDLTQDDPDNAGTQQFTVDALDRTWDAILTGATHNISTSAGRRLRGIQEFQGYEGGAVFIDTINGTAGTTDYENGTVENPVDSIADANTIAASLGLVRFTIAPGSLITFAATQTNQVFRGESWTLALGGQDISSSHFQGAKVTGVGIGASIADFNKCSIGTCTLNAFRMIGCEYTGTLTLGVTGDYLINEGYSGIAGSTTPIIDMGASLGNVNLTMPKWHNGIEIQNLNSTGADLFSISGVGQIIYAASSSGAVNQRGDWKVTNTGGVTITADDNTANVAAILVDTAEIGIAGAGLTDIDLPDQTMDITGSLSGSVGSVAGSIGSLGATAKSDVNAEVDSALNTAIPGSPTANSVNERVAAIDNLTQSSGSGDLAAILNDTNALQTDWAEGGRLDLLIDRLIAEIDTARAEPGQGLPASSAKIGDKIDYLYKAWRNKSTQTASTYSVYDDAGTTVDHKSTVSDDGTTATRGEIATGP